MTPKEKLFKIMDRIKEIKSLPSIFLTQELQFELRNLEVKKMQAYSDWKD